MVLIGSIYRLFEGVVRGGRFGAQGWIKATAAAEFHDFAGSVVVHAVGGWIGRAAVLVLGGLGGVNLGAPPEREANW